MRILIVKTTSMGDVLHVLPALTELSYQRHDIVVDWLVEEDFAEIPHWHPKVNKVVPVSMRRWNKLSFVTLKQIRIALRLLREHRYDVVIDAQGLMKSAVIARCARLTKTGVRAGYSKRSLKETPASWLYSKKVDVSRNLHAVARVRQLFAKTFEYPLSDELQRYGIKLPPTEDKFKDAVFLFTNTTWHTKHFPEAQWRALCEVVSSSNYQVMLSWNNELDKARAERLSRGLKCVTVLPNSSLSKLVGAMQSAAGVIAVDTGLGHAAAALDVPCVSIYGATDSQLTGTYGQYQAHISVDYACSPCLLKQCAQTANNTDDPPCYQTIDVNDVWNTLRTMIEQRNLAHQGE